MSTLLLRSALRFYLRHPAQTVLAFAGISLGVAVFIGVTLANDSAIRAFEESSQFVRGRTTHRLLPVGRPLSELTYAALVRARGLRAAPVLEVDVRIGDENGPRATLLGIDPIEELGIRDFARFEPDFGIGSGDGNPLLGGDDSVLVSEQWLEEGTNPSTLRIITATGAHDVRIAGSLGADASDLVIADIATAQALSGQYGTLSRIDLVLTAAQSEELARQPPEATALVSASNENAAFTELSRAFRINVAALGLLALVIGAFLIYSTMAFAVTQRRRHFGIQRALGVSRREIMQTLACEALVLGTAGAAIGIALGSLLASLLIGGVAATIDDFAFRSAVAVARPSTWLYARGCALGLGATLIAAAVPILDASRVDPMAAMGRAAQERTAAQRTRIAPMIAGLLLVIATVFLLLPTRSLNVAFAGLACVLAAGAAGAPAAIVALARWLEPLLARIGGLGGRLAARNVRAQQSRIAVAAAALTMAVSAVIGVGVMVGSFRASLTQWLDTTLTSDVFVNADAPFDPTDVLEALGAMPGIVGISLTRFTELPSEHGLLGVRALAPGSRGFGLHIVDGDAEAVLAELAAGTHIAVAEPLAYRIGVARGDTLSLPTPSGPHSFDIAGVYRDYNTGGASVLLPLGVYRTHWNDETVSGLGLELEGDVALDAIATIVRASLPGREIRIATTESIKQLSLQIFDRTFEITNILRTLAGIVAFLGMLSALLAIQLERQREFATLRALGLSPRGFDALIMTETGLTGIAAGVAAVPIGLMLAALLIYVINQRSFGWTMELAFDVVPITVGLALAIAASTLAGIVSSLRSRAPIDNTAFAHE